MAKHIQNAVKFGVPVVVAINRFAYVLTKPRSDVLVRTLMLNLKLSELLHSKPEQMQPFLRFTGVKVGREQLNWLKLSSPHAILPNKTSTNYMI